MKSTKLFSYLFFLFCFSYGYFSFAADGVDWYAVDDEFCKKIDKIEYNEEEKLFMEILKHDDWLDSQISSDQIKNFNFGPFPESTDNNESSNVDDSQFEEECIAVEKSIIQKIKEFINNNPSYKHKINEIKEQYLADCKKSNAIFFPFDLADKLAKYFRTQGQTALAIYFYKLAASSMYSQGYEGLSIAETLVEYYNRVVKKTRPKRPTSALFGALVEAIKYNDCASGPYLIEGLGSARNSKLKPCRDAMVRWPLCPEKIINDPYYAKNALLNKIYAKGFVDKFLKDTSKIKKIWPLKKFNGSNHEDNIFHQLYEQGFACSKGFCGGQPQYILVNEQGYLVRIKRSKKFERWEFTIGLSFKNPIEWKDGYPHRLLMPSDIPDDGTQFSRDKNCFYNLLSFEQNEMIKIVLVHDLIMIIPGSYFRTCNHENFDYWANYKIDANALMDRAHRSIKPIGRSGNKKGLRDTRKIDDFLSFKH